MLLRTASFVKMFRSITLEIWKYSVQKVKIFLFLQNITLVMMRWLAIQAKGAKKQQSRRCEKRIFAYLRETKYTYYTPTALIFAYIEELITTFFNKSSSISPYFT
jgi:hypothetical protein